MMMYSAGRLYIFQAIILAQDYILPPWDRYPRTVGYVPWVGLGIALVYILYQTLFVNRKEKERQKTHQRQRLHDVAVERNLNEIEEDSLAQVLERKRTATPMASLASRAYFDNFIRDELIKVMGAEGAGRLEEKLFPHIQAVEPEGGEINSTRDFAIGQQITMRLTGINRNLTGIVLNLSEYNFTVTFQEELSTSARLHGGERVHGVVVDNNARYIFDSVVEESHLGDIRAVIITHSDSVRRLHRRGAVRVEVSEPIIFAYMSPPRFDAEKAETAELNQLFEKKSKGTMRDVSLGGCSLMISPNVKVAVHDLVRFEFQLFADVSPHLVMGKVVDITRQRIAEEGDDATTDKAFDEVAVKHMLHISFFHIDDAAQNDIAFTVDRITENARRKKR